MTDREVFDAAMEISCPEERAAYLDRACAGDSELFARVRSLLDAFADASRFMETGKAHGLEDDSKTRIVERPREHTGSIIGNYKLLQEIGDGGFGAVYMAEQQKPVKRRVALKIIKPGMDTREIVARFEAERQALALMEHPNIAQVFDGGTTGTERPYFVMELVKGIPITEFCDKNKLSTSQRLDLFQDVCAAIQHAHQKGIIHRDIKPSNVLVTLHDGVPVPKVIDFGIAKALNQELTEKTLFTAYGQMIGTPLYASPEQAEMSGLDIDTRSDIYSLGALLYELLTGETPISRQELKEAGFERIQKLITEKEPTKPSMAVSQSCRESTTLSDYRQEPPDKLISAIKGDLDWIILKALEKDRNRRYETAAGLAEDIRRCLNNEPVLASPPTPAYLLTKFVRRHKRLLAALAGVFVALLLGAIGMTLLYFQAREDREDALRAWNTALEQTDIAKTAQHSAEKARAAESRQRELAQTSEERTKDTLALADFVSGVEAIHDNNDRVGIAHLVRSLRTAPAFKPAAQALVSALRDRNHDLQPTIILRHDAPVTDFSLNATGDRLVSRASDGSVRLWDSANHKPLKTLGENHRIKSAEFTAGGRYLVTLQERGVIRVWDAKTVNQMGRDIHPDSGAGDLQSAVSSDGRLTIATRSTNGRLQLWDGLAGIPLTSTLRVEPDLPATGFRLNHNGSRLIGMYGGRNLAQWDARTGEPAAPEVNIIHNATILASNSRGLLLDVGRDYRTMKIRDLKNGELIREFELDYTISAAPFSSPDESQFVSLSRFNRKTPGVRGRTMQPELFSEVFDWRSGTIVSRHSVVTPRRQAGTGFRSPVIHRASGISLTPLNDFRLRAHNFSAHELRILNLESPDQLPDTGRFLVILAIIDDKLHLRLFDAEGNLQADREETQRYNHLKDEPARSRQIQTAESLRADLLRSLAQERVPFPRQQDLIDRAKAFFALQEFNTDGTLYDLTLSSRLAESRSDSTVIVFSPAGDRFALKLADHRVEVRRTLDGRSIASFDPGSGPLTRIDFSPDGQRLISRNHEGTLRIWDAAKGTPLSAPLLHTMFPSKIAFSPDGNGLYTLDAASAESGGGFGVVRVWDTRPGRAIYEPLELPSLSMIPVQAAGGRVIVKTRGGKILCLDSRTRELSRTLSAPGGALRFPSLSVSGDRLLAANGRHAYIWDLNATNSPARLQHPAPVTAAALSGDGSTAVAVHSRTSVRVWNAADGRLLHQDSPLGKAPSLVQLSHDGGRLLIVAQSEAIIWNLKTDSPEKSPVRIKGDPGVALRAELSPDGDRLATASLNKVRLWNTTTGALIKSFDHSFSLHTVRFSQDGRQLVATGPAMKSDARMPGQAMIWEISSHKLIATLHHPDQVREARFAPGGESIITTCKDDKLRTWHIQTGQLLAEPIEVEPSPVPTSFAIDSEGLAIFVLDQGKLRPMPMPFNDAVVPEWLLDLAEAVIEQRLDSKGLFESVPESALTAVSRKIDGLQDNDNFSRFARWFIAQRDRRAIAPAAKDSIVELVGHLAESGLEQDLRRALSLDPDQGLAAARLAARLDADARTHPEAWLSSPESYAQRSTELAPNSVESWATLASLQLRRGKTETARDTLQRISQLAPDSPDATCLGAILTDRQGERDAAYQRIKPLLLHWHGLPETSPPTDISSRHLFENLTRLDRNNPTQLLKTARKFAKLTSHPWISEIHSNWLSRLATELAPSETSLTAGRMEILALTGHAGKAVELGNTMVAKRPDDPDAWFALAKAQAALNLDEPALRSVNRSLDASPSEEAPALKQFKLDSLVRLGRFPEARALFLDMSIRPRSPKTPARLIDLSKHYNAAFSETWFPFMKWAGRLLTLEKLPTGVVVLDSTPFDIRGLIQLSTRPILQRKVGHLARSFPASVSDVKAPGKWRALHFLHAANGANNVPSKARFHIGSYVIHYADGRSCEIPIELEQDVWHWIDSPGMLTRTKRSTLAWQDRSWGTQTRLYHTTWTNPWPENPITHIDISAKPGALFPFVVAITAE